MDHRCPADCSPVLSWTPLKSQYIYIFYVLICPQTNIDTSLNKKQQIHHIRVDMQCWGNSSRPASAEMCGRLNTAPNHLHPYCRFLRTICLLMEACSKHTDLHLSMIETIKGWMSSDGGSYTQSQLFCWKLRGFFRSVFFPFHPRVTSLLLVTKLSLDFSPHTQTADGQLSLLLGDSRPVPR